MARVYELTEKGRGQEHKGQKKLVHNALLDGPRTVEQIAEAIKKSLETRQEPAKVVAFYMSVWKKQGLVRVVNEVSETPANVEKTDEPQEVAQLTENTPVPDENLAEETSAAADESAELNAEGPAGAPTNDRDPALQQRDGETLMSYVFRLTAERGPIWPSDFEELTFGAVKKKQAQDTLRRLQGNQHVAKSDEGYRAVSNNPYRG